LFPKRAAKERERPTECDNNCQWAAYHMGVFSPFIALGKSAKLPRERRQTSHTGKLLDLPVRGYLALPTSACLMLIQEARDSTQAQEFPFDLFAGKTRPELS